MQQEGRREGRISLSRVSAFPHSFSGCSSSGHLGKKIVATSHMKRKERSDLCASFRVRVQLQRSNAEKELLSSLSIINIEPKKKPGPARQRRPKARCAADCASVKEAAENGWTRQEWQHMRIILASGCVSLALLGWVRCVAPPPPLSLLQNLEGQVRHLLERNWTIDHRHRLTMPC